LKGRRPGFTVFFVFFVALAARALHVAFIRSHPYWALGDHWPNSDMNQYIAWARHLAAGDWLDLETFRAWFEWQAGIAPPEVWDSWFGAHVYYQPPLYTYFVALVIRFSDSFDLVRFLQIAIGAANAALVALLGLRISGVTAARVAGLAAAIYAPWILYDAELLRNAIAQFTQLLVLFALVSWHGAEPGRARRLRAILAGCAFGVSWLADPVILLFAPLASIWMMWAACDGKEGFAVRLEPVALFLAGAAVAVAPLVARNTTVGAPPLAITTRGPLAFVMGNAPDAQPAGAVIPGSTPGILNRSGYTMAGTMRETLRLYDGRYGQLLAHQWAKLEALWGAFEIPDNPSFYYAARISPVIGWGLRFPPVAAAGLVGLALMILYGRDRPPAMLVPVFLAASMGLFVLAHVVSRYRQPMVAALFIAAGHAVGWALSRGWKGRAAVVSAAMVMGLILPRGPAPGYGYNRPAEFIMVAKIHAMRGETEPALEELDASIKLARRETLFRPDIAVLHYEKGLIQADAGRPADAAASFRAALRENPSFEPAAMALREVSER